MLTPGIAMRLVQLLIALLVAAAAFVSGLSMAADNKMMVVLPLAAVVGVALSVLACTRFSGFVLLLLAVRSSVDVLDFSAGTAAGSGGGAVNPSGLLVILFLLASALWLATRYYSGTYTKASPLTMWLVAFWLAGVVSLLSSKNLLAGATESLRILGVVMMFVLLEQLIVDRKMMVRVLLAAYASLLIPLGYTLFGLATGTAATEDKDGFARLLGTFNQSNAYARYLTFMIVFGVAIYPHLKGTQKVVMRVLLLLSTIFLLQTLTLTCIIAAIVGLIVIGIVARRGTLLAGFVVVAVLAAFAVPGLAARFDVLQTSDPSGAPSGNTLAWRFNYWAEVLPLANRNPVTGIGLGSTSFETDAAKQPHNDFLRAYVETGVVGLLIYIGVLASFVATSRRAVRRAVRGTFAHAVATGALACAVLVIVESLTSNVITNSVALWYLVAFVAAAGYVAHVKPDGFEPVAPDTTSVASVDATQTTYQDTQVTPGKTYYYEVVAVNAVGESAASNEVSFVVTSQKPSAPVLSATTSTGKVSLSWSEPDSGSNPITKYTLVRDGIQYAQTKAPVRTYDDVNVVSRTSYVYQVRATSLSGNSPLSNPVTFTVP